jgi:hypothetical protein
MAAMLTDCSPTGLKLYKLVVPHSVPHYDAAYSQQPLDAKRCSPEMFQRRGREAIAGGLIHDNTA